MSLIVKTAYLSRPSTTPTYAVGQVVGTNPGTFLSFPNLYRVVGGSANIVGLRLHKTGSGITNATFRVHFFNVRLSSVIADAAAYNRLWVDLPKTLGHVDLPTMDLDGASSGVVSASKMDLVFPILAASDSQDMWALITARAGYVGSADENFQLDVHVRRG